jgi:hypothetical protein
MNFDVQAITAPPNLIKALRTGFDAITNHLGLILLPMAVDLFLWFGPHLQIKTLLESILQQISTFAVTSAGESQEALELSQAYWAEAAQRINLFAILRTLPVGVPSLMASRQPIATPLGNPQIWEVTSLGAVMGIWVLLSLAGLAVGTFYFMVVAQASLSNKISWRSTLANWPAASLKVLLLALLWLGLFIAISFPASCLITLVALTGFGGSTLPFLIFGGIALWLFFPLIFSPHGIFANQRTMWGSVSDSVRLTRLTLPTTGLILIIFLVISEGTDLLWNIPEDASWLTLLALTGHAFITTGLLAASFVYYRDAMRWTQRLIQQTKLSSLT